MAAALVAVVAVAAIVLSLVDSGDAAPSAPQRTYVVRSLDPKPRAPGARTTAAASTPARSAPVPALAAKPARGPAFTIARLRPGARVALWKAPGRDLVRMLGPRTEFGSPVTLSVVEGRAGWLGVTTPDLPNGELGWVRRDPGRLQIYWTKYSLHADLSSLSLSLRYGDGAVARFLVTVGAPGSETPIGRYGITDALSFDESPFYGCCALALSGRQTHLPPGWIGGNRLAIHGTPGPVGGAESHGCIRATDATMRELFRRVPLGTPVFVSE